VVCSKGAGEVHGRVSPEVCLVHIGAKFDQLLDRLDLGFKDQGLQNQGAQGLKLGVRGFGPVRGNLGIRRQLGFHSIV